MFTFTAHEGPVTSVAFAGPTGMLLSTGIDGSVKLWNPMTGENLLHLAPTDPAPSATASDFRGVFASATGQFAAVTLHSCGVEFINLDTGRESGQFLMAQLFDAVASPDGHSLFVVGRRGQRPPRVPWRRRS